MIVMSPQRSLGSLAFLLKTIWKSKVEKKSLQSETRPPDQKDSWIILFPFGIILWLTTINTVLQLYQELFSFAKCSLRVVRFVPFRNYEYFSRGFSLGSILSPIHIVMWMCRGLRIHNDNKTLWGGGGQEAKASEWDVMRYMLIRYYWDKEEW